jgi:hypothetical protein
VELLMRVARANALGANWDEQVSDFSGSLSVLAVATDMINHSCSPNARFTVHWDSLSACPAVRLHAIQNIRASDELTISYVALTASKSERATALKRYGFECKCSRCVAPFDDTQVMKCPHCLTGRVFLGATTCHDCGVAIEPGVLAVLPELHRAYLAKPRKLRDLVFADDISTVAVHMSDAVRLDMIYKQLAAAWSLDASESERLYDIILPAMEQNGCQYKPNLPQLYLLAGHCSSVAGNGGKAAGHYEHSLKLHARTYGSSSPSCKLIEDLCKKPRSTKADIEKWEVKRLEVSNWVRSYQLPMSHAKVLAEPLQLAALAELFDKKATGESNVLKNELIRITQAVNSGEWLGSITT